MHSLLTLLSLLLAALAAHAQYGRVRVHQAQLNVRLAHSHDSLPPVNKIITKGRSGDSSITQEVILKPNECVTKVTWDSKKHIGVNLVGVVLNITMLQSPLPKVTIDKSLTVSTFVRVPPCHNSGVVVVTWELDYVILHTTKKPKVADHPPVAVDRRVELTTPPYITVIPSVQPVAVARHIGIIWV